MEVKKKIFPKNLDRFVFCVVLCLVFYHKQISLSKKMKF